MDFDSAWEQNVKQMDAELERMENEAANSQLDDTDEGGDSNEESESESKEDVSAD